MVRLICRYWQRLIGETGAPQTQWLRNAVSGPDLKNLTMNVTHEDNGDVLIQRKQLLVLLHKARQMQTAKWASLRLRWLAVSCHTKRAAIEKDIARNDLSDLCYTDITHFDENETVRISKECFESLSDEWFRHHALMR